MKISTLKPSWSRRFFVLVSVVTAAGWLSACNTTARRNPDSKNSTCTLFTDAAGGFSVLMPMTPQETAPLTQNANGPTVNSHEFFVDPDPSIEMGVMYNDFPESLPNLSIIGSPSFFDTAQEAALKQLGAGRLISTRDGVFASHPMREIRFQVPDKSLIYQTRIYVAGHRMYQIIVVSSEGVDASHEVDTLFNSFKLLNDEPK